ncbi:hypothetical protein JCM8547_002652 [Rhodosporidiobolus lusitaniae]
MDDGPFSLPIVFLSRSLRELAAKHWAVVGALDTGEVQLEDLTSSDNPFGLPPPRYLDDEWSERFFRNCLGRSWADLLAEEKQLQSLQVWWQEADGEIARNVLRRWRGNDWRDGKKVKEVVQRAVVVNCPTWLEQNRMWEVKKRPQGTGVIAAWQAEVQQVVQDENHSELALYLHRL